MLGVRDENLHPIVLAEERVFFTNNESDFVDLCEATEVQTGLVIIADVGSRTTQQELFHAVIDYIERQAETSGEPPADWMLNKRVEIAADGSARHEDLPA